MPDPIAARKPGRLGLYLPFALLGVAIVVWSGIWLWARGELQRRLDVAQAILAQEGYHVSWAGRAIGGYPFRLDVTLSDVRAREPSGWALQAPRIEAEAPAYAPGNWLVAAPEGLTFVRPEGGPVQVSGRVIRASLTHLKRRPPNLSFQGIDLAFRTDPGARPFGLEGADRVEFHLRAGPDDQGGVYAIVERGRAHLTGLFARVAEGQPIGITWNATLSKMSAFAGRDWADAVRRWSQAGGRMSVLAAGVTAGEALVKVTSGDLGVDPNGRVAGALQLSVREAPKGFSAMADTGVIAPDAARAASAQAQSQTGVGDLARGTLRFAGGRAYFGPIPLGPAPKAYDLR